MRWPKMKVGDIVHVEWEDHYHNYTAGWSDEARRKSFTNSFEPLYVSTVGFLVANDDKRICTSPMYSDGETNGGVSVMIKSAVRNVRVLSRLQAKK